MRLYVVREVVAVTFTACDVCGRPLEHHGDRYTLRIEHVPAYRDRRADHRLYDLCPQCAARMKVQLGRRDGYIEIGGGE